MSFSLRRLLAFVASLVVGPGSLTGQDSVSMPRLHHVGLNSVDPDRAIAWYLALWPTARRTTLDGQPG